MYISTSPGIHLNYISKKLWKCTAFSTNHEIHLLLQSTVQSIIFCACGNCEFLNFQLIDDKKNLTEKCENLVKELKTIDRKYQDKIKMLLEKYVLILIVL